jgi:hypothetical protein
MDAGGCGVLDGYTLCFVLLLNRREERGKWRIKCYLHSWTEVFMPHCCMAHNCGFLVH